MKKSFDSVGLMRDIRKKLSEKYGAHPDMEQQELRQARARFEKRLASKTARVAEKRTGYGNNG